MDPTWILSLLSINNPISNDNIAQFRPKKGTLLRYIDTTTNPRITRRPRTTPVRRKLLSRRRDKQRTTCPSTRVLNDIEFSKRWESQCTLTSFLIGVVLIPCHCSGAFSNVFKAQDLTTGQKVASTRTPYHRLRLLTLVSSAVKVVRKYELSSQQVSVS